MKLVFQKYMEFESTHGNKKNVDKLRERVEEYLNKIYDHNQEDQNMSGEESDKWWSWKLFINLIEINLINLY